MSKTMKGTLMTLIAGIAWGLSGVSGQYLMVHGFSAIELTNLRLLFSGIFLPSPSYFCLFRIVIDSVDLFRGDC